MDKGKPKSEPPVRVQRVVRALRRDYNKGIERLTKWRSQVQALQAKIDAQNKDLDALERKLIQAGAYGNPSAP